MSQIPPTGDFDELSVQRAVHWLSRTGVRTQLSVERIKQWVKQFQTSEEKTLAWLILRNLIFRTNEQLHSSMRQALKQATIHFVDQLGLQDMISWQDALKTGAALSFLCGPPSLPIFGMTQPGRSGELIARMINQRYGIRKQYPSDVTVLELEERFIVVDDGTYTGTQLANFLHNWDMDFSGGRVAIAVAIAHTTACEHLKQQCPNVPLFYGELLTADMCFEALSERWRKSGQWTYEKSPLEVYDAIHQRNQPFDKGNGRNGFGSIGALVAFEHGVPDDSIQLLWDVSPSWKPLVDR